MKYIGISRLEMGLGRYNITRKTGQESFHFDGRRLDYSLFSFWQWSSSDILGNSLRGALAEYIVVKAVGCTTPVREQWDMYDLITPDGVKIEVKSASYLQSWEQVKHSSISFGIQPTYGWDAKTNKHDDTLKRQADVYVFCLLSHKDKTTVDPMNLDQWDFYVLKTEVLDDERPTQKTITLASLLSLDPIAVDYAGIANAIKQATGNQLK